MTPQAVTRFIVLGTQRAGTTLVRTCLDSHPAIRCIGETFDIAYAGELGYRAWCSSSPIRRMRHRLDRGRLVSAYLDELFGQPGYRAIGLKYMYNHTKLFERLVPYVLEHRVRVIHVVRENALKTFVSRAAALSQRGGGGDGESPRTRGRVAAAPGRDHHRTAAVARTPRGDGSLPAHCLRGVRRGPGRPR